MTHYFQVIWHNLLFIISADSEQDARDTCAQYGFTFDREQLYPFPTV